MIRRKSFGEKNEVQIRFRNKLTWQIRQVAAASRKVRAEIPAVGQGAPATRQPCLPIRSSMKGYLVMIGRPTRSFQRQSHGLREAILPAFGSASTGLHRRAKIGPCTSRFRK